MFGASPEGDSGAADALFMTVAIPVMLLATLTDSLRKHNTDGQHDDVLKKADAYLTAKPAEEPHNLTNLD